MRGLSNLEKRWIDPRGVANEYRVYRSARRYGQGQGDREGRALRYGREGTAGRLQGTVQYERGSRGKYRSEFRGYIYRGRTNSTGSIWQNRVKESGRRNPPANSGKAERTR